MKSLIIPLEFFKAIGEKPQFVRICWIKWLADYNEELFRPDFPHFFCESMKEKNLNLETIKEAYDFGIVFFKDGLLYSESKKTKKTYSQDTIELIEKILLYLNERSNSTYTKSKANMECINARIIEGYTISDFKRVIDKKCKQWLGTTQEKYLRPITLFQASKFENYLNEPENESNEPKPKPSGISKLSNATNKAKEYVNQFLSNQR